MVEPVMPLMTDNTIQRMRWHAGFLMLQNWHPEYIMLIAFSRQQWLRQRAYVLRVHSNCLFRKYSFLLFNYLSPHSTAYYREYK